MILLDSFMISTMKELMQKIIQEKEKESRELHIRELVQSLIESTISFPKYAILEKRNQTHAYEYIYVQEQGKEHILILLFPWLRYASFYSRDSVGDFYFMNVSKEGELIQWYSYFSPNRDRRHPCRLTTRNGYTYWSIPLSHMKEDNMLKKKWKISGKVVFH